MNYKLLKLFMLAMLFVFLPGGCRIAQKKPKSDSFRVDSILASKYQEGDSLIIDVTVYREGKFYDDTSFTVDNRKK